MAMVLIVIKLAEIAPFAPYRAFRFQILYQIGKELLFAKRHALNAFLDLLPIVYPPPH